jgi:branched-subunit amino acid transport protein
MSAILVALAVYALLPSTFLPALRYVVVGVGIALLIPIFLVNPMRFDRQTPWSRVLSTGVITLLASANTVALVQLLILLFAGDKEDGARLTLAAVQVWVTQVIAFALIYWELDRGGPVTRTQVARAKLPRADFRFPQDENAGSVPDVSAGSSEASDWTANFVDYLYFSLGNSMAFSPPDAMPLTNRAKILAALQALSAFAILVVVFAKAVSQLG